MRALRGVIVFTLLAMLTWQSSRADERLKSALKDTHADGAEWWVYNDLAKAREIAKRENKPIFVTFRCVPCANCKAFDAEVAAGKEQIDELSRKHFVPVRQVEMKGVDLTQFEFDYDLNWAAMFINADGTVYARYGTQSAEGADAYNSIAGLKNTMQRVLELHKNYPGNRDELVGKRDAKKLYKTALELPGLENKWKYKQQTERKNCIHCHNIHDAQHNHAFDTGKYTPKMLFRWPLPENIGLVIAAADGMKIEKVKDDSPASRAGVTAGGNVTHMNGQAIASIADMQWVLHKLDYDANSVKVRVNNNKEFTLSLPTDWKKTDISWRGSTWSAPPKLAVWMPPVNDAQRKQLGLDDDEHAFHVRFINGSQPGGREFTKAGIKINDFVTAVEGKPVPDHFRKTVAYIKLNHKPGERVTFTVRRGKQTLEIPVLLTK